MDGCAICDIIEELRPAVPPDWSGGFPWYVLGDQNATSIQVVSVQHYDDLSTDPVMTGAAVSKVIAEAQIRSITAYTIVLERFEPDPETITHLSVSLIGS